MSDEELMPCSFQIPHHSDKTIASGERHCDLVWERLVYELVVRFDEPAEIDGAASRNPPYEAWDTARPPNEEFRQFSIKLGPGEVDDLRRLLADCCVLFDLRTIELSVGGEDETIGHPDYGGS